MSRGFAGSALTKEKKRSRIFGFLSLELFSGSQFHLPNRAREERSGSAGSGTRAPSAAESWQRMRTRPTGFVHRSEPTSSSTRAKARLRTTVSKCPSYVGRPCGFRNNLHVWSLWRLPLRSPGSHSLNEKLRIFRHLLRTGCYREEPLLPGHKDVPDIVHVPGEELFTVGTLGPRSSSFIYRGDVALCRLSCFPKAENHSR